MIYFQADARDNTEKGGCHTCCCESASVKPGETNLVVIDYRSWAAPMLGKGLAAGTRFNVSRCINCDDVETELPVIQDKLVHIIKNHTFAISVDVAGATDIHVLNIYGPEHGEIIGKDKDTKNFIYSPYKGFTGYDTFWVSARDAVGNRSIGQVLISIDESVDQKNPDIPFTPPVSVPHDRVEVDRLNYLLKFPIALSPAAKDGDIYRIEIRQPAIDCDCNKFWHKMCIDVTVGKCA